MSLYVKYMCLYFVNKMSATLSKTFETVIDCFMWQGDNRPHGLLLAVMCLQYYKAEFSNTSFHPPKL